MKKILLLLVLVLCMSNGCSSNISNLKNKEEVVYCSYCGVESDEMSKYCKVCGEETKWLNEEPSSNANATIEEKEEVVDSRKDEYLTKLSQVESSVEQLSFLYETATTSEMVGLEYQRLTRWDDLLNEIYGVLKEQLSSNEIDTLRNKQREWISYRDSEADKAASEFEGGT